MNQTIIPRTFWLESIFMQKVMLFKHVLNCSCFSALITTFQDLSVQLMLKCTHMANRDRSAEVNKKPAIWLIIAPAALPISSIQ